MSEITWYGHSAFKISTADVSVLIDPFFSPVSQMSVEKLGHVDMVLVTHDSMIPYYGERCIMLV